MSKMNLLERSKPVGLLSFLVRPLAGLAVVVALPACGQPHIACVTARGAFAAKYTLRDGSGACATLVGDTIGVQSYNPRADGLTTSNLKQTNLAIQPKLLGDLVARAAESAVSDAGAGDHPYAFGGFTASNPDAAGFCAAPTLQPAHLQLPEVPAIAPDAAVTGDQGKVAVPATDVEATFSDVRFFVTPAAPGTQMSASLHFKQDGCEANYEVRGLYPAVPCANDKGAPDASFCKPEADPEHGHVNGSGISPDFRTRCDEKLLLCVLDDGPLPVLKAGVDMGLDDPAPGTQTK